MRFGWEFTGASKIFSAVRVEKNAITVLFLS
jgi:hypothetical protein